MRRFLMTLGLLVLALGPASVPAPRASQDACRVQGLAVSREANIFSTEQESALGDFLADRHGSAFEVVEDEALTAELRRIGSRVAAHMPAGSPRVQLFLSDLPEVNAFVIPGGRIFVTRRLVGFVKSEDELAGVLGHEMGHLVARQATIDLTRQLREVLRVTELGDREDVYTKYNRLMDNWARKPSAFRESRHDTDDQIEADRLGLRLVSAAGYDVQAFASFYDRLAETKGKTGSMLARLFGATSPESRRLREILRSVDLPGATACVTSAPRPADFAAWQNRVLGSHGLGSAERLPGLLSRTSVAAPLRGELSQLRFSPDGRFVLAQDGDGITILTREPFAVRFRIPAPGAEPAQFTSDSTHVLWHSRDVRIERWSVADGRLVDARNVVRSVVCEATSLSPDASLIACLADGRDLLLIDAATQATIYRQQDFYRPTQLELFLNLLYGRNYDEASARVTMRFSPDGRFFAAGSRTDALVFDVAAKKPLRVKDDVSALLMKSFVFVGPDRLLGVHPTGRMPAGVIRLPDATVVERIDISATAIDRPASGDFLLVRPIQKYAVGLLDLTSKKVIKAHAMPAFDVYGDHFVAERGTGDVGLYAMQGNALAGAATLPTAPLQRVLGGAVSTDFRWLAVSERSRGAVWDLSRNARLGQVRPFAGAHFDADGVLFADFVEAGEEPRAVMRLDPARNTVSQIAPDALTSATQQGGWFFLSYPLPLFSVSPTGVVYELRPIDQTTPLWRRTFERDPPAAYLGAGADGVVLSWPAALPAAHDRIRANERLRTAVKGYELHDDYLLEVLDARSGESRGLVVVETGKGSFAIRDALAIGERVLITDDIGRVLVYSLASGALDGYVFGHTPMVSVAGGRIAVGNGDRRVMLYDLASIRRSAELVFRSRVVMKAFSGDGTRLFVLTADQTAFVFDVAAGG